MSQLSRVHSGCGVARAAPCDVVRHVAWRTCVVFASVFCFRLSILHWPMLQRVT